MSACGAAPTFLSVDAPIPKCRQAAINTAVTRVLPARDGPGLPFAFRLLCTSVEPEPVAAGVPARPERKKEGPRMIAVSKEKISSRKSPQKRAFEPIAERIKRQISAGRLLPGERLPPEREMASRCKVS